MKIKFNTLCLGVSLALIGAMVTPTKADESNKETKLEFSAPVEVPGRVLAAGKYVFKIADNQSDRNIVEIFSEDADGNQKFVTTILAISDYREETPDKTIITFEERPSGSPEAIHSWFYPGDNTGWEFVYPKSERSQVGSSETMNSNKTASSDTTSADAAPALSPARPTVNPAPTLAAPAEPVQSEPLSEPVGSVTTTEDDVALIAQNNRVELLPAPANDDGVFADRTLPQTAGRLGLELVAGLAMLCGGVAVVFVARQV